MSLRTQSCWLGGLILLAAAPAAVAQCSSFGVVTTGVAFGVYDPLSPASTRSTGSIEISCTGEIGGDAAFAISLSSGNASSFGARQMTRVASGLVYNLFTDPSHALVWGDGSGGTHAISDLVSLTRITELREYGVYGSILPGQHVPSGEYSDSIVVTISF